MLARLQSAVGRINWLVVGVIALSLFMGVFVALFGALADGEPAKMVALPAFLVLLLMLTLDRRFLLLSVLVLRASGDIAIAGTKVGALINAFVILLSVLMVFENPQRFPQKQALPWLIFLALSLFGLAVSPDKAEGIRLWLGLLSYFAIFVSGFYLVRSKEDLVFCIKIVVWSSLIPALYAFVDIAINRGAGGEGGFRMRSTFGHANIFAFYLTLVIAMVFYLMKSLPVGKEGLKRFALGGYLFLLLGMLALTQTRSAWLGCFLLFFGYALFFERKYFAYMLLLAVVALCVPGVLDRLTDLTKNSEISTNARLNSFAWRVFLWQSAFEWMSFKDYIIGRGLQAFKTESIFFFPQASGTNWNAHSAYVQVIFELGLVGLSSFAALYLSTLPPLWRLLKREKLTAFIFLAIVVNYMFAAYSDNVLDYLSFDWYLWFVLGIACAYAKVAAPVVKPKQSWQTDLYHPPHPPIPPIPPHAPMARGPLQEHV